MGFGYDYSIVIANQAKWVNFRRWSLIIDAIIDKDLWNQIFGGSKAFELPKFIWQTIHWRIAPKQLLVL